MATLNVWAKRSGTVLDSSSFEEVVWGIQYYSIKNTSANSLQWGPTQAIAESATESHMLPASTESARIVSNDKAIWVHAPAGGGDVTYEIFAVGAKR